MSEPETSGENFLQRWSRLKQATGTGATGNTQAGQSERAESDALPEVSPQSDPPAFDPSTLPPIESISAASDIRAFLAPGVPEELSRAALRRAWVSDPTIRDFVGIAENQWDFTRPDDIPGFGSLEFTTELRQMLDRLVGSEARQQATDNPVESPHEASGQEERESEAAMGSGAAHNAPEPASAQKEPLDNPTAGSARRRHGGALPR